MPAPPLAAPEWPKRLEKYVPPSIRLSPSVLPWLNDCPGEGVNGVIETQAQWYWFELAVGSQSGSGKPGGSGTQMPLKVNVFPFVKLIEQLAVPGLVFETTP
jgi:hypothetical protein